MNKSDIASDIETVMTRPDSRRQGMASALLRYAAGAAGGRSMFLNSAKDTVSLYENVGFVKYGKDLRVDSNTTPR